MSMRYTPGRALSGKGRALPTSFPGALRHREALTRPEYVTAHKCLRILYCRAVLPPFCQTALYVRMHVCI